jgi:serine/threonine-protein kinase
MSNNIRKGAWFGSWRLVKPLGWGGNGTVWLARNGQSTQCAIKFLNRIAGKNKQKVYTRFRSEVSVVRQNQGIPGILPIIEFSLPESIEGEIPWYIMPVATPLPKYLEAKNLEEVMTIIVDIGHTLIKLHKQGISHRDIKPENMLFFNGRAHLSDFGLVDYPEKEEVTSVGEQIGARWTIAPEMKRNADTADGKAADVYSFAKTIWILLTGIKYGFEGQYNPDSIHSLARNIAFEKEKKELYLKPLDQILTASTNDDPLSRPSMESFVADLMSWTTKYRDYRSRNPLQWRDVQIKLFPEAMPERAIWENRSAIAKILNYLSSIKDLNHILLPSGGGIDLVGVVEGVEENTLDLMAGERLIYRIKPKRLVFESFGYDWEWNYFRLENDGLSILIDEDSKITEHLVEIQPFHYLPYVKWDYEEHSFAESFQPVHLTRLLHGDILILQKTSIYNQSTYTYDGRHSAISTEDFRSYILGKIEAMKAFMKDPRAAELATQKNIPLEVLARGFILHLFSTDHSI